MVKVLYLIKVEWPVELAGDVDDEKEIPESDANRLAAEGYVKIL